MTVVRSRIGIVLGTVAVAMTPFMAEAATSVVNVQLDDRSAGGALTALGMKVDHREVKAGRVTFRVSNTSRSLVHEMMVVPVANEDPALPYDAKEDKVAEESIHSLGEVSDLRPGAKGTLTVQLKPGSYLLLCNQPGHYHAGMYSTLTVIP
jgi:uncharacterized cupredoxin-like copper-binding protein